MKYIALVLLLGTCGCGFFLRPTTVNVTLTKTNRDYSRQEIGEIISFALKEFGSPMPAGWNIIPVDHWIVAIDPNKPKEAKVSDGLTLPNTKEVLVFFHQSCLADSSLIHEIGHVIGFKHTPENTRVVKRVLLKAINKFCPSDYLRQPPPPPNNDNIKQYIVGERNGKKATKQS